MYSYNIGYLFSIIKKTSEIVTYLFSITKIISGPAEWRIG